jgi:tripartite-type tricarboxylate transporter receptor subunit TctC
LRGEPGSIRYASAGDGTPPHFAAELFQLNTGTKMEGSTHEGAAPAIVDTLDGRSQVMFPSLFTAHPFILDGRLRALAVAAPARLEALPAVPTLTESGIEGVDVSQWYGLFAPACTPPAVVAQINRALNEVLANPQVIARFERQGARVEAGPPSALRERVRNEFGRWQDVVAEGGLAPQDIRLLAAD